MNNVQAVFDKVIAAGIYDENSKAFALMCLALSYAYDKKVITLDEMLLAKKEINSYLMPFGSLAGMLAFNKRPWDFESRLAIYKDWANRPRFK